MNGLIDQARTQLWKVVNEFTRARRDGVAPQVEVALYHYGSPDLGQDTGYVKQLTPLTTDLDKVSEELFKLTTRGGQEYCGTVIKAAVEELKWSVVKGDYKVIFIAGNEPFTQGSVDYKEACKAAIARGIMVNTIHCGAAEAGIKTGWKEGADLADGAFMNIDQNRKVPMVAAPQDKELAELSANVNTTYVAYGKEGEAGRARQSAMDSAAAGAAPAAAAERAATKGNAVYQNAGWDLVDAINQKKVKLEDLKEEDLPEEMKKMTLEERQAHVEKKVAERKEIQDRITQLSRERADYIAKETARLAAAAGEKTLDQAMIEAVRNQAQKRQYKFEEAGK
jgi:hypothetical protein